jgi:hypothetical protein
MTAIWVANNINKSRNFLLSKAEVLCTVSCLIMVKHFYPEFKTIFLSINKLKIIMINSVYQVYKDGQLQVMLVHTDQHHLSAQHLVMKEH